MPYSTERRETSGVWINSYTNKRIISMRHLNRLFSVLLVLAVLTASMPSYAQLPLTDSASTTQEAPKPADDLGRDTPRGTFKGFLKSVAEDKYDQAASYLNQSSLTRSEKVNAAQYARDLQTLLDRQGMMIPDGSLSDQPEGSKDDDLPADVDNVASLRGKEGVTPVNVERVVQEDGRYLWLISADFVKGLPALAKTVDEGIVDKVTAGKLSGFKVYGAPLGHWLIMLGLYAVAYLFSGFIVRGFIRIVRYIFRNKKQINATSETNMMSAFELPLRLYVMVLAASLSAMFGGVSVIVRHAVLPLGITIVWVAVGLFLWGIADIVVSNFNRKMAAKGRYNMTSTLAFVRRGVKIILFVIILIFILNSYGVDVTAGLAALGIGGIALALGAQKTLENFIGSLSIVIDQPLYVGDFCKIGDTTGTVEDIGMRSTRLRTNERTVVTIPNGELSGQRIENFARRSRFLLNRRMVLRYDASSEAIRDFLDRGRAVLADQPKIVQEGVMLRLLGFSDTGYLVEIWCNVQTGDVNEFLSIQAEVTLAMIDAARDAGVYFAIPSQTFLPAVDQVGLQKSVKD